MKKILTLCAGLLLVFGLCACNGGDTPDIPGPGENPDPDEVDPNPEVIEPGPETGGEGGETQYIELTLGKYEYELEVSSEEELVVSTNTPASITFSSTDDTIAFAGENDGSYYIYSGATTGEAIITVTATADGWEKDSKDVKVTVTKTEDTDPVVTGISFDNTSYEVQVGGEPLDFSEHVTVSGTNNPTQEFTLTSDDTAESYISIVDNVVTAKQATIENTPITLTATREDHGNTWTATAELTVIAAEEVTPEVTSIAFNSSPYSVTYQPGQANTLDLSNAVTVTGNETLTDTSFTITCEDGASSENEYISISNNVVTIKNPTSSSINIKAYANADPSKTADGIINVSDGTIYVTDIAFEGIEGDEITLYTGNTDETHPGSASVTANVTPAEAYETGYDIVVENTSVAKWENNTLEAVAEGTTKITATSTGLKSYNGEPATCEATVTVQYLKTPVESITLSPTNTKDVYSQGSFTIGPSDSEADIKVTVNPSYADEPDWKAEASDSKLEVTGPNNGVYTVTAEELVDGSEVDTSSVVITPTGYAEENASATLTVRILPNDYGVTHVTAIELTPSTKTAKEGDTFTIGTDVSADVSVSVLPAEADNRNYSVTCEDTTNIDVSAPDTTTGLVTITVKEGAGGSDASGQTYDIVVTADDTMNNATATLTLTVERPESVATSWEVSGGEDLSLDVPAVGAPETDALDLDDYLTITILDQYHEPMEIGGDITGGYTITESDSSVISFDGHKISAVAGTANEATTITISSTDVNDTATLTISLTAVTYDATEVTFEGSTSYSQTVEWGGTLSGTVVVTPLYVTETGYDVALTSGVDNFTPTTEGDTLTFKHDSATAGTGVYTITSTDGKASCTVTLTVEPKVISIASAEFAETVETTAYKGGTLALDKDMIEVTYEETSLSEGNYTYEEYDVNFTEGQNVTIEDNTATFTTAGEAVINATVTGQTSNVTVTAELDVTVSAYVESISLTADTTEVEGGSGNSVTITATLNSDATNTALTWSSSDSSVIDTSSVGTETSITVTPAEVESDTQVTITATAQDGSGVSNSITITVTAPIPTTIDSYTLSFTFSEALDDDHDDYEQLYIVGSWMEGQEAGAWDLTNLETLSGSSTVFTATALESVEIGTDLDFAVIVGYNKSATYADWTHSGGGSSKTIGDYPWYANTIVYEGSVTVEPDGNNYTSVTKSISVNASPNIHTNPGYSAAEYVNYTVALQDTGDWGAEKWIQQNGSSAAFYIEGNGSHWTEDTDGNAILGTMTAETSTNRQYDFYYNFGSTYSMTNDDLSFQIAPDEWSSDLSNDALAPTDDLVNELGSEASDGTPFAKYVSFYDQTESGGGYTWTTRRWTISFWTMYEAIGYDPLIFADDFAIVLEADFSKVGFETWSEVKQVTGFHFVINGNVVAGISVPATSDN